MAVDDEINILYAEINVYRVLDCDNQAFVSQVGFAVRKLFRMLQNVRILDPFSRRRISLSVFINE